MVTKATSLIIADHQESGIVFRTTGHRIDNLLLKPGSVFGHVWRVLGEFGRADDEADFWQGAIRGSLVEGVEANE